MLDQHIKIFSRQRTEKNRKRRSAPTIYWQTQSRD